MKDYSFSSHVLARIPLLDCSTGKYQYQAILDRKDFQSALFFASRSFYNELSKKNFDYYQLSGKQQQTVKKYINRAMFRSTPFGMFAAASLVEWGSGNETICLSEPRARLKLDFAILQKLWQEQSGATGPQEYLQTNATVYFNNIDFRYIKKVEEAKKVKFSVVSIEKDPVLKSLLSFCKKPSMRNEILEFITSKDFSAAEAADFVHELVAEQVLVSALSPNITGPDYQQVVASCTENKAVKIIAGDRHQQILESGDSDEAIALAAGIDDALDMPNDTNYFYCLSQRDVKGGSLDTHYQKSLQDGLNCLLQLCAPQVSADLQSFIKAFIRRYETGEVPLLEVLDAQFGIGYGGLDQIMVNYGFSSTGYNGNERPTKRTAVPSGVLATELIHEWQLNAVHNCQLEITDDQLRQLDTKHPGQQPAPSVSLLFRTLGDEVYIESAGGASALSLIGRFSFEDNVCQYAKTIAQEEQRQNKNIIFAEIAHLCDLHTANINRRPHLYDYEIPVLTNSLLPAEKQIGLDDLLVSVRNDKVILRSKRLDKIIIPRLSSAFNFTRNDLPVFRFLCDLQGQDIQVNLGFSLSSLVPGLPFYPRVKYKSCILQLAEWHLDANELKALDGSGDITAAFHRFAMRIGLPKYFSYSVGDNFLVFDSDCKEDIDLFLKEVQHKKTITLKEFPFLEGGKIQTENGSFLSQYVAGLVLQKEVYNDVRPRSRQGSGPQSTDDWVYCKLYCHPLSSDIILLHHVFPFIQQLKEQHLIQSWFWVRYNDPEYHLRVRVKVEQDSKHKVLRQMTSCLDSVCANKLGSHFQTDRYKQELERYSSVLMGEVEDFFHESSELVASWLSTQNEMNYEDSKVILGAVISSLVILNVFEIEDKAGFCKNAFESFFTEFNAPKELKTEMEKLYRVMDSEIDRAYYCHELPGYEGFIRSAGLAYAKLCENEIKEVSPESLALDMIHMHLNRLFIYNQRYFEMVHYYLLYRSLYKYKYKSIC